MKATLLSALEQAIATRRPVGLALPLDGSGNSRLVELHDPTFGSALREALRRDRPTTVDTAAGPVFLRPYAPRLRMVVIGAVHITAALVTMAQTAGYEVILIDPRQGFAHPERWPGLQVHDDYPDDVLAVLGLDARTAVVALTHDPKIDDPGLEAALASDAFYIGALGSRRTHASRLARLAERGHSESALARIHGPIGLDIQAATPAEIAVAILAEVTADLRRVPEAR
jgi:xanthine dehydrogenase accessory factor